MAPGVAGAARGGGLARQAERPAAGIPARLGLRVRSRNGSRAGAERRPQLGAADLVGPLPADVEVMAARVGGAGPRATGPEISGAVNEPSDEVTVAWRRSLG